MMPKKHEAKNIPLHRQIEAVRMTSQLTDDNLSHPAADCAAAVVVESRQPHTAA